MKIHIDNSILEVENNKYDFILKSYGGSVTAENHKEAFEKIKDVLIKNEVLEDNLEILNKLFKV